MTDPLHRRQDLVSLAGGVVWLAWAGAVAVGARAVAVALADLLSIALHAGVVIGGLAVVRARHLDRAVRVAWGALAMAFLSALLGETIWVVRSLQGEVGFPSISDPLYLAMYPLLVIGLLSFPARPGSAHLGARIGLDLALVFTASTLAVWDAILRPAAAAWAGDPWAVLFAAGPPVGDLVVASGLVVALRRRPDAATGEALFWVALGMVAYVTSDLVYASQSLRGVYEEGSFLEAGWLLGTLLVLHATQRQRRGGDSESELAWADQALARAELMLPTGAVVIGFVLILRVFSAQQLDQGQLGTALGAALLCAAVLVREAASSFRQAALTRELAEKNEALAWESERSERLLRNVLPDPIADELKDGRNDRPIAALVPEATVLFADLVGFTSLSTRLSPERLLALLDRVFSAYDALADEHGLEKIKTIGDAYMAAAGVPRAHPDPVAAAVRMALGMQNVVGAISEELLATGELTEPLRARAGVHTGPLVAGVIGQKKFSYDLWGDTVNTASRLESHGVEGRVQVSDAVRAALGDRFVFEDRGEIVLKGRGPMRCWLVVGERPPDAG